MADLCTLADVRLAMETKAADTALDSLISSLLPVATRAVQDWSEREFLPTASATRRFRAFGTLVSVVPYDLRSVTSVVFDPTSTAQSVIAADYRTLPTSPVDGVYSTLLLSGWVVAPTAVSLAFGFNEVDVTGAWGFLSVPDTVRQAAIIAIRSWLRRDVASYGQAMDNGMRTLQPEPFGTYKLPPASKAMLDPFCRRSMV